MIQHMHLYHVKDDSDLERIMAKWAQRKSNNPDQPRGDSATKDEPVSDTGFDGTKAK
jgi:hypothetical protein